MHRCFALAICILPSREEGEWWSIKEEVLHLDEACHGLGKDILPNALCRGRGLRCSCVHFAPMPSLHGQPEPIRKPWLAPLKQADRRWAAAEHGQSQLPDKML